MKLRKDYEDIYHAVTCSFGVNSVTAAHRAIAAAVERCQALADSQPTKHLTDAEIMRHFDRAYGMRERLNPPTQRWLGAVRAVVDAAFEKQKERPVEPFDFEKLKTGEWEVLYEGKPTAMIVLGTFAEYPGLYAMRRKS